jgi:Ni/Co efflux regulator RcnB
MAAPISAMTIVRNSARITAMTAVTPVTTVVTMRREYRQDQRAYDRYQRAERRYNAGRWQQPRGTRYQTYGYGQRLPSSYNAYVVNDYGRYGLRAPPRGYHYVRNGNDVVLAAVAGGLITAVIAGLFN